MERITVIAQAATKLRASGMLNERVNLGGTSLAPTDGTSPEPHALGLVKRICARQGIRLREDKTGSMLGGAHARLRLWNWAQPEYGGSIWFEGALSPDNLAFSIAHELGHYMLHRGEGEIVHRPCKANEIDQFADLGALREISGRTGGVEEYSPRVRRELEANAFAAELLMPRVEVRRRFLADDSCDALRLAEAFGVAPSLAWRRLADALLTVESFMLDEAHAQGEQDRQALSAPDGQLSQQAATKRGPLGALDKTQLLAACADGPTLVVAGPGTGKTATLVGRVAYLLSLGRAQPEQIVALTFSNRAASEMRERLIAAQLPGERIPVMTIHAFAAGLLREYAPHVPHNEDEPSLTADFRILDSADNYLLIEEILPALRLRYYHTRTGSHDSIKILAEDFSHARNGLLSPADYLSLVKAMPLAPVIVTAKKSKDTSGKPKKPDGMYTQEEIDKAYERALAYGGWDRALRRRGLLDFGGLIVRAVELLRARPDTVRDIQARFTHLMVDEFQDTNSAAAEMLFLLTGNEGKGFWVVGDHKQAIYRWRGAAPENIARLLDHYPQATAYPLETCYRSLPDLVATGMTLALRMNEQSTGDPATAGTVDESPQSESTEASAQRTREALAPVTLVPARGPSPDATFAALYRLESLDDADEEAARLAITIEKLRAAGYAYHEQAILCRKGAQVAKLSQALEALGVPVMESEAFYTRPEIKDALTFLTLAAGPDGQGLLRANAALRAMALAPMEPRDIARLIRRFAADSSPLPGSLKNQKLLEQAGVSARDQPKLMRLGEYMHNIYFEQDTGSMGIRLGQLLLRPGGYVWRLGRIAEGEGSAAANARAALAALGELMRLAFRFDLRWREEPDFRTGMMSIVTQTYASPTIESAPPMEGEGAGAEARVVEEAKDIEAPERAPMARCFLRYVRALRLMNVTVKAPTGAEDAVALMTLHASKGLEFPVVYLPYLTNGQFPAQNTRQRTAQPAGFRRGDDRREEEEAEERRLFYVGLTRARDVVVFSWARYSARHMSRSSLLSLLDTDARFQFAGSPLAAEEESLVEAHRARLASQRNIVSTLDDDDEDDAAPPQQRPAAPVDEARQPLPVVQSEVIHDVYALERYLNCPLAYRYVQQYGFHGGAMEGALRYHRYVRLAFFDLIDLREAQPSATWDDASRTLDARWQSDGLARRPYAADYRRFAENVLRRQWDEFLDDALYRQGRRQIAHEQQFVARMDAGLVRVSVDMVISERMPDGQTQVTLARVRSGLQRGDALRDDNKSLLYALAYQQHYPDAHPQIVHRYLGASLLTAEDLSLLAAEGADAVGRHESAFDAEAIQPVTVDVTESVNRMLKSYQSGKKSRLRKLDRAQVGIAAGQFGAKPDEQKCSICPFCFACPADPEEEESLSR